MSVVNIMSALEKFFKDLDIPLKNARFACMDSTNVRLPLVDMLFMLRALKIELNNHHI